MAVAVAILCRKHNCSEQSFYRWKSKDAGIEVSDAKRLKELGRENAELMRGKWRIGQERAANPNSLTG